MKSSLAPEQAEEFTRRHAMLLRAMHDANAPQYVVTHPESIFYLTGATFEALERPFFLVIGADGRRQLLVPVLELDHLQKAWGISEHTTLTYREYPAPAGEGWSDRLLDGSVLSAGFGFEASTPHCIAAALLNAGGQAMDLLEALRLIKSDWEVGQIERAAAYADWGVERILRSSYRGASVAETYSVTQQLTRKIVREVPHWDALATKVIAAAWPAPLSAEPHAIPSLGDRLDAGPHVAMVLTRVNGYAAECERTFFTAPPNAEQRETFELLTEARRRAFGLIRPGVECAAIDETVNRYLDAAGYSEFRTRLHRCGHGFGLGNHEPPWLAVGSTHVLAANMLISIEPGLYRRGVGGYRHSDTVLVTQSGYRCLTRAPTSLAELTRSGSTIRNRIVGWAVRRALRLN